MSFSFTEIVGHLFAGLTWLLTVPLVTAIVYPLTVPGSNSTGSGGRAAS